MRRTLVLLERNAAFTEAKIEAAIVANIVVQATNIGLARRAKMLIAPDEIRGVNKIDCNNPEGVE